MADHDYSLLGFITLDAGSWADWFSGTMSFGAVATALAGYVIVHRQRMADNLDRERQVAEIIGWKLLRVCKDTATVGKHLKDGLNLNGSLGRPNRWPFETVSPIKLADRPAPDLSQAEISLLLKMESAEVMTGIDRGITNYASIRILIDQYRDAYEAFKDGMPKTGKVIGSKLEYNLDEQALERLEPMIGALTEILSMLVEQVGQSVIDNKAVLDRYLDAVRRYFGSWHFDFEGTFESADLTIYRNCRLPE